MYQVDDKPETLHIYVVREEASKPPLFPIFLSVFALSILLYFCVVASSYPQPVTRAVIRVPAILLPLRTFQADVAIIPTGIKTYPATTADGTLTLTNGSVISQELPKNFIITANNGIEVVTNRPVFVPAGSANYYGSSLYIRNLKPFTGGRPAYSVKFVTIQDRSIATANARQTLLSMSLGLHYPCNELVSVSKGSVSVSWECQIVTYHIPTYIHVLGVRLAGNNLVLSVWFVERPKPFVIRRRG